MLDSACLQQYHLLVAHYNLNVPDRPVMSRTGLQFPTVSAARAAGELLGFTGYWGVGDGLGRAVWLSPALARMLDAGAAFPSSSAWRYRTLEKIAQTAPLSFLTFPARAGGAWRLECRGLAPNLADLPHGSPAHRAGVVVVCAQRLEAGRVAASGLLFPLGCISLEGKMGWQKFAAQADEVSRDYAACPPRGCRPSLLGELFERYRDTWAASRWLTCAAARGAGFASPQHAHNKANGLRKLFARELKQDPAARAQLASITAPGVARALRENLAKGTHLPGCTGGFALYRSLRFEAGPTTEKSFIALTEHGYDCSCRVLLAQGEIAAANAELADELAGSPRCAYGAEGYHLGTVTPDCTHVHHALASGTLTGPDPELLCAALALASPGQPWYLTHLRQTVQQGKTSTVLAYAPGLRTRLAGLSRGYGGERNYQELLCQLDHCDQFHALAPGWQAALNLSHTHTTAPVAADHAMKEAACS